jgi:hypothetical protein
VPTVNDLLYVALTAAFFLLAFLILKAVDRL